MAALSIEILFASAVKLYLTEERAISLSFTSEGISIRFPTTRRLAEYLEVPHYYILPYFAMMEEQELVTRAERVGILTTNAGSSRIIRLMKDDYPKESSAILGDEIFRDICARYLDDANQS
ncbi:MAG TPA: hypothetical protein VN372_07375 [Methanospirillum sp.]|nr:hypothetical protein [Methanospirillum sp.]